MVLQQAHAARAQMSVQQALAMQRQAIEQVHARQAQMTSLAKIAQRQKEQLRAQTDSKLKDIRCEEGHSNTELWSILPWRPERSVCFLGQS